MGEHRDGCHRPLLRAGDTGCGHVIHTLNFWRSMQSLVRYRPRRPLPVNWNLANFDRVSGLGGSK
jgi:hypothetical protein